MLLWERKDSEMRLLGKGAKSKPQGSFLVKIGKEWVGEGVEASWEARGWPGWGWPGIDERHR